MVGTVNAAPNDFRTGVDDLIKAEALFPVGSSSCRTKPAQRGKETGPR